MHGQYLNSVTIYGQAKTIEQVKPSSKREIKKNKYQQTVAVSESKMQAVKKQIPILRANPELRQQSPYYFTIYDADVDLLVDEDGDGFFSEFELGFDPDVSSGHADVYAKLYLSKNNGPWVLYYTTEVFEIYSSSGNDDYEVRSTLNFQFPTGNYDILIDLYEYGYDGIVATFDASDDSDLYFLPLEDKEHEVFNSSDFQFSSIVTELLQDDDNDGFHQAFSIEVDVDLTHNLIAEVYAKIYLRDGNNWSLEFTTETWTVVGNNPDDAILFSGAWESGYASKYYDFKIELLDRTTDELLITAGPEFAALAQVPLEDTNKDIRTSGGVNPAPSPVPPVSSSGSGGGGALSLTWLLLLVSGLLLSRAEYD